MTPVNCENSQAEQTGDRTWEIVCGLTGKKVPFARCWNCPVRLPQREKWKDGYNG